MWEEKLVSSALFIIYWLDIVNQGATDFLEDFNLKLIEVMSSYNPGISARFTVIMENDTGFRFCDIIRYAAH